MYKRSCGPRSKNSLSPCYILASLGWRTNKQVMKTGVIEPCLLICVFINFFCSPYIPSSFYLFTSAKYAVKLWDNRGMYAYELVWMVQSLCCHIDLDSILFMHISVSSKYNFSRPVGSIKHWHCGQANKHND